MKVSLVSTVYNEQSSIFEFLNSIAEQTRLPDEVIIVDGGSTDGTVDILREFAKHSDFVLYIACEGKCNIARGRNLAIRKATNEIIAVTDAGSRLAKNWLEMIVKPFNDPSIDVIGGWYEADPRTDFEKTIAEITFPKLDLINPKKFLPSSRSLAFRKSVWEKINGYPEWLTFAGEDTYFDLAILKKGYKIHFERTAIVYWRPRKDIKSFAKQMYLYGFGDGEARQNRIGFFVFFAKFMIFFLPILALPFGFPFGLLFSSVFSGAILFCQLRNISNIKRLSIGVIILFTYSMSYLRGYVSGVFCKK